MRQDRLEQLWKDPANWKGSRVFGYYDCPEDGRVIVPKRSSRLGWTINLGHRLAFPALFTALLVAVGPALVMLALLARSPTIAPFSVLIGVGVSFVLIFLLSRYFSNREI